MSLGQILLLILSIALFMTVTLNYNSIFVMKAQTIYSNISDSNALALGEYLLEEAWTKKFDENQDSFTGDEYLDELTDAVELGRDGDETYNSYPYFDDIDDYNKMNQSITFADVQYNVTASVYYTNISGDSLNSSASRKMVVFRITNPGSDNPVEVKQIFSLLE